MIQLQFSTKLMFYNPRDERINIQWNLLNEGLEEQCAHTMEFVVGSKTTEEIINSYAEVAKNEIFKQIEKKFPKTYTL